MKRRMKDQPLDSFTRSYIETALWSSMDNADESGGEPLDANYSASDIDPETMAQMIADAYSFQERNAELLSDSGLSDKRAGFYFWLSRNGHGSGFFDEDLDALQDAAKAYGEFDLVVGDDGVIYGSPLDQRGGGVNEAKRRRTETSDRYQTVRDFSTLPELVEHARDTEGATHVLVHGKGTWIYYPSGRGYKESEPWRERGYWHQQGPNDRPDVDSLPAGAETIESYLGRSAQALAPNRDRVHWKGDFSNNPRSGTIEISGDDGYAIVRWDDGKTERVPTSLFSTPRWSVERRGGPPPPPAAGPQPISAPAPAPTRSAHKPPERARPAPPTRRGRAR